MSKKAWIIGGVAVVAVIGATIIGRSLAGAPAKEGETASSAEVITLKVAHMILSMKKGNQMVMK